jgi:uncharacterized cupredoxin-like copper-binding protein
MKKLLFGLALMLASVVAVNAQDSTAVNQGAGSSTEEQLTEKEMIAVTELPAMITQQLQGQDYTGWAVSNAYKKEKEGKTFYAVELKNGEEKKIVKFDDQGNKIKEKTKE